jgi:hypothetical protein
MVSLSSMQTTTGAKASVVRDTARVERPEVHAQTVTIAAA